MIRCSILRLKMLSSGKLYSQMLYITIFNEWFIAITALSYRSAFFILMKPLWFLWFLFSVDKFCFKSHQYLCGGVWLIPDNHDIESCLPFVALLRFFPFFCLVTSFAMKHHSSTFKLVVWVSRFLLCSPSTSSFRVFKSFFIRRPDLTRHIIFFLRTLLLSSGWVLGRHSLGYLSPKSNHDFRGWKLNLCLEFTNAKACSSSSWAERKLADFLFLAWLR